MKNIKILIGFFILLKSYAISDSNDDFNKFGFLEIKTDSMNVPFFVDGYYVGSHPLPGPEP